jgi:uncharacterized membrane protein YeaQ/YmgE (transglycosylase-associated protein family)
MGFIAWIVVGAMAGILVNRLTGTGGELLMIVFGMIGGLAGGYVTTNVLNVGSVGGINLPSLAIAAAGGLTIALIGHLARNPGTLRRRPV